MIKGIGASTGVAIGSVKVLRKQPVERVVKAWIGSVEEGLALLENSLAKAKEDLEALMNHTRVHIGEKEAEIFSAHLMMLEDPEFLSQIKEKISKGEAPATAVKSVSDDFIALFSAIDDAYLRERAADLKDVSQRLLNHLLGVKEEDFNEANTILVAEDLSPSDTAKIDKDKILGFITEIGGSTSHSAIMARTIGIPAVVGVGEAISALEDGMIIAMDGDTGAVYLNPNEETLEMLSQKKAELEAEKKRLETLKGKLTYSLDGQRIEVACNIGGVKDLKHVLENDGEGIGLFRSEFLYMDRSALPTEDEQYEAYAEVLKTMGEKPVVIRTLDVGGDKNLPYLNIPKEENPFLGFRAIRYCLKNEEVFITQIKALLRAGVHGNLKIMMPMISGLGEVRAAKSLIERAKEELKAQNIAFSNTYQLGIMIEIPSAALIADQLAKEVDFFSIGTNDLIQYTVAVDRMNQDIAELYNPYHPAVIRLIAQVIKAGKAEGIWVGMCGETAGNPALIPLYLGLGLDEFSMNPSKVLKARSLIASLDRKALEETAEKALTFGTPEEVKAYLESYL